jgi:hypothetical protein
LQGRTSDRAGRPAGRLGALAVAAALLFAGPASAGQSQVSADGRSLTLYPGERVVVRLEAGGKLSLVSAEPAAATEAEPPKPGRASDDSKDPPAGALAFTLGVVGGQTLLKIDSGLSQAMDYRARLRRDGAATDEPSSVCTVLPLLASFEHWPYAVGQITLSRFATRATNEVVCPDPAPATETTL